MARATDSTRSGQVAGSGTENGMPDPARRFFARVSLAAIVGTGTRNNRAMVSVGTPSTNRSARAGRTSSASAGWVHMNSRASRSSTSSPGCACPARCCGLPSETTGARLRATPSWRRASSTRRSAAVRSQPVGFAGTSPAGHDAPPGRRPRRGRPRPGPDGGDGAAVPPADDPSRRASPAGGWFRGSSLGLLAPQPPGWLVAGAPRTSTTGSAASSTRVTRTRRPA